MTHHAPVPIIEDCIKIPRELISSQCSVTLCLNGMNINDISFMTTISKNLMYRTAWYIQRPLASIYRKCLQQVLRIYTLGGFCMTTIHCDNEFCPLMDPLNLEFKWIKQVCKSMSRSTTIESSRNKSVRLTTAYHTIAYLTSWWRFLSMILPRSWTSSLPRMESLSITVPVWFCISKI